MSKKTIKSMLKTSCNKNFTLFFRGILYNNKLSWGEKCVGLACLDVKGDRTPSPAKLARKFNCCTSSISRFKKGLVENAKVFVHPRWQNEDPEN